MDAKKPEKLEITSFAAEHGVSFDDNGDAVVDKKSNKMQVQMTRHEFKLFHALMSHPNRVDMWVSRRDPMKLHKEIFSMYVRFFEIANTYDISYWLEYGSSLGYCRHRGIMPWEWDMDIGCTPENFKKLQEIGDIINKTDPKWGFKFYKDDDYETAAYCFYLKSNDSVLCDICEYLEVGDKFVCAVKEWHYPDYNRDDVLPPRRVAMMGQSALVMKNAEKILTGVQGILGQCTGQANSESWTLNTVPWKQYDPVPFLLTHMYHPKICEIVVSPPFRDVPIVKSLEEGLRDHAAHGRPFVIRQCQKLFNTDFADFRKRAETTKATTFAWDKTLEMHDGIPIIEIIQNWEKNQLQFNLVDSNAPGCLTGHLHPDVPKAGITEDMLLLCMAPKGAYTRFHIDPFSNKKWEQTGGGWVYLHQGHKLWNLIDYEETFEYLYDDVNRCVIEPCPQAEMVYQNDFKLWGRGWNVDQMGGDFLYFPPAMTHRVWTYTKSWGLCGYLFDEERDGERCRHAEAVCNKYGTDGSYGLWKERELRDKVEEMRKLHPNKPADNAASK